VLRGFTPRSPLSDFERIFARRGRGEEIHAPEQVGTVLQAGIALALGIVILVEYQLFWPFATLDAAQPEYFQDLAEIDNVRAVLNVPVNNSLAQMVAMYQQTIHGKAMIGGQLYRRTPQDPALLAVLGRATAAGTEPDLMPPMRDEDVRYMLAQVGADRVIVHRLYLPAAESVIARLTSILGQPEYRDQYYEVFAVPRGEAPPENAGPIFAASEDGWSGAVKAARSTGSFSAILVSGIFMRRARCTANSYSAPSRMRSRARSARGWTGT
jgi:hypothetical protein